MARTRRPKQIAIEGTRPKVDPELDKLIDEYVDARDQRIDASQAESKAKKKLLGALASRELKHYVAADDTVVDLQPTDEKLKVTKPENATPDDEHDLDEGEVD